MSTVRPDSHAQQYGRRRSNTAQSILRNLPGPPPQRLKLGDVKVLNSWVHEQKESSTAILNQTWLPGVTEGDMLQISGCNTGDATTGYLFMVPKDEGCPKPALQISLPKNVADAFGIKNNGEVTVTKVDKQQYCADYIEFTFQDQYLGRNEMWRLAEHLVGQCVFVDQEISFISVIAAKIQSIYVKGRKVSAGCVTATTKAIYRSLSAKVTIFIQVCRELWEFAGDGERYNEKIIHSFLPALFTKWREAGTNHTVTIVLISRVYYDESELKYAAGPLRWDEDGRSYKDFYRVITDLEVIHDWKATLERLKVSFWAFQRDILLAHHYHQASVESTAPEQARLIGQLSDAHEGPILEALNLGLNPNETHYIDRSLSNTGASTILITPGTGYYKVSKQLLRLTTTRMLDQGFGLDLVSLAKRPLHQTPIFAFKGYEPRLDKDGKNGGRALDPLWGGDEDPDESRRLEKTTFWWEPFWIGVSFWDKQMDLPFRQDRFVARAKMHEIQMLGLLEHDVLSGIEVPYLPELRDPCAMPPRDSFTEDDRAPTQAEADQADMDVFVLKKESRPIASTRTSYGSSTGGTIMASSYRSSIMSERRGLASQRSSITSMRIAPIEESPRKIIMDLPPEGNEDGLLPSVTGRSTSPSQSSIRSVRTNASVTTNSNSGSDPQSRNTSSSRLAKIASSWFYNPFQRSSGDSQTPSIPASSVTGPTPPPTPSVRVPIASNFSAAPSASLSRSPQPMAILHGASGRLALSRTYEEESILPHRSSLNRHSPMNTPPRDESTFGKRRSTTLNSLNLPFSSSSPVPTSRTNPSRPQPTVSYAQSSLARRWQHVFPTPTYKHEVKWKSMVTPACLPLTMDHFPSNSELESSYDVFSYDFVVDPTEMRSFLVKPPSVQGNTEEVRRAWALTVMRGMVAVRLAQGFQFVLRPRKTGDGEDHTAMRRTRSFMGEEDASPKPAGAAEVLKTTNLPVYLSMSNEIHRISYTGEAIQVRRYVRRMPPTQPFEYECLIWPKLGVGYTELKTKFVSHGLENFGWNRLDMLVAGYEHQFNESLRYWRTRFVVIPSAVPEGDVGPPGEKLNDEEIRLMGIDKLADIFTKLRWQPPDERGPPVAPMRVLPTTLGPAHSVLDESLMAQLDEIHAAGPLKKKMQSTREIADTPLSLIAKLMREEDGVPIKFHQWHGAKYPDSFTGFDFISWLVREFRDVSSRVQGAECGARLLEQGLFSHCRGRHGLLDGHYFYQLNGEYASVSTPRGGWIKTSRYINGDEVSITKPGGHYPSSLSRPGGPRRNRKCLILSQTMVIDIDPAKRSDQAESVVLHHDIIQNPGTVFHFELQWIGSTARCIEDSLRQWSRAIERFGLKLVEAYVMEIGDIRERNAFQSCFPLRLVIPPPIVLGLEKRVPEGTHTTHYFEYAILKRFDFVLDVEATNLYPKDVDVSYSYRRAPFKHSQFVHRSGVAFVQVIGGSQGLLFLTNRLLGPGRMGSAMKSKEQRPEAAAEEIRMKLQEFCSDEAALIQFYDEELAALGPDDPPPLSI